MVDTCAAEFEAVTPYFYGTYEEENEAPPLERPEGRRDRLGPDPDRPGHRVRLLLGPGRLGAARGRRAEHHDQLQPRDRLDRLRRLDRLYFEPLDEESGARRARRTRTSTIRCRPCPASSAARRRSTWPSRWQAASRILGSGVETRSTWPRTASASTTSDRPRHPAAARRIGPTVDEALTRRQADRLPGAGPPVVRARRPGDGDRPRTADLIALRRDRQGRSPARGRS